MIVETERHLAAGGDAIARAPDGRIIFIEGACPSEQVRIEVVRDNKTFLRARVIEVLRASLSRVEPRCRYFDVCGGCTLQHVSAEAQLESKEHVVIETVARIGGQKIELEPTWSGSAYGYRSRARIAINDKVIGYRKRESREIVDVEQCPILTPELQDRLIALRTTVLSPSVRASPAQQGERELGSDVFEQANAEGNAAMVAHVEALAKGATKVLELYAGSGNFTRVLPGDVHAIEANEEATKRAPMPIECASVEEAMQRLEPGFDLLVLDPPRTGASAVVLDQILRLKSRRIIYVSCDPATFARDVKRLSEAYRLERLRVFDLYPQTSHIEVIGLLLLG